MIDMKQTDSDPVCWFLPVPLPSVSSIVGLLKKLATLHSTGPWAPRYLTDLALQLTAMDCVKGSHLAASAETE